MLSFLPNSGSWAVAAVHLGSVGQYKQLLANAADEGVEIAAGQVGAANTALEKHIATHHKTIGCTVKTDATGAVAWGKQHLQCIVAQLYRIARFQIGKGAGINVEGHIVHEAAHAGIFKYLFLRGVEMGL